MNLDELLTQSTILCDELKTSPEIIEVEKAQKAMLDDLDVILLMSAFQTAQDKYNDAVRLNLENANDLIKEISLTKEALYCHPLVIKYMEALKKANAMLDAVTALIFDDLIMDFAIGGESPKIAHCVVGK